MGQGSPQPGWYADPAGTPWQRWWDGGQWTEHTQPPPQVAVSDPGRVQRQVQEQARVVPTQSGGGTLFSEPVLVVNQKAKLIELTNEYAVYDRNGTQLGSVVQVGQSGLKKAMRFVSSFDQFMTHRLEVRDSVGRAQLVLTRPAKFVKSTVVVSRPDGQEIGRIAQQNAIGKIRFDFETPYGVVGSIRAENWRAWNFAILDQSGAEVARITKTWEGLAKTMFTTADNYVVQIHRPLDDPLLSMVVASALSVDTALKQDDRGFG